MNPPGDDTKPSLSRANAIAQHTRRGRISQLGKNKATTRSFGRGTALRMTNLFVLPSERAHARGAPRAKRREHTRRGGISQLGKNKATTRSFGRGTALRMTNLFVLPSERAHARGAPRAKRREHPRRGGISGLNPAKRKTRSLGHGTSLGMTPNHFHPEREQSSV